jgi:hypothetical protein
VLWISTLDTAAIRRNQRESFYIKDLRKRFNCATDEEQRLVLQRRLRHAKLEFLNQLAKTKTSDEIRRGRVIQKVLLHPITQVKDGHGTVHFTNESCADLVHAASTMMNCCYLCKVKASCF